MLLGQQDAYGHVCAPVWGYTHTPLGVLLGQMHRRGRWNVGLKVQFHARRCEDLELVLSICMYMDMCKDMRIIQMS